MQGAWTPAPYAQMHILNPVQPQNLPVTATTDDSGSIVPRGRVVAAPTSLSSIVDHQYMKRDLIKLPHYL